MIISASRRTDIPAFYGEWFLHRLDAGHCLVPNPFNPRQVSRVQLTRDSVDAFVFWTRRPAPFQPVLERLDGEGFPYLFLVTLTGYPKIFEPDGSPLETRIDAFLKLTKRIGPERVLWRYDPIILSSLTDAAFHRETFSRVAGALAGSTRTVIVSVVDMYQKTRRRFGRLRDTGVLFPEDPWEGDSLPELLSWISGEASSHGMEVLACAEDRDLSPHGIPPGSCIDAGRINRLFGTSIKHRKDPGQRWACGCSMSRDIGVNETCPMGCLYCYATSGGAKTAHALASHDPRGEALVTLEDGTLRGPRLRG